MQKTSIEWTDASWNPTRGCSRVSEGCRNCYAEKFAARFAKPKSDDAPSKSPAGGYDGFVKLTSEGPRWTGKVELIESKLDEPLHWKKPRRVFVNSMSDLFHESLTFPDVLRVFEVMWEAKQHTYQILTKRPRRMLDFLRYLGDLNSDVIPPHIWLGVSVEDQATADDRIPLLLQTPAAVRFVSYEPALGPVSFERGRGYLTGESHDNAPYAGQKLHWVIAGGESGPHARPPHPQWFRDVLIECQMAQVAYHFKQWGEWAPIGSMPENTGCVVASDGRWSPYPVGIENQELLSIGKSMYRVGKKAADRLLDGHEWNEFPCR